MQAANQNVTKDVHIFGIRHHGPGSARSLSKALAELQPDVILVEGPPEADAVLPFVAHADMTPPVALLLYLPDEPQNAVYYPFAKYSPEWQAISYGLQAGVPVRFMDLPQSHQLGVGGQGTEDGEQNPPAETIPLPENVDPQTAAPDATPEESLAPSPQPPAPTEDPLGWLAQAAGYSDGERWWEQMVEHRQDGTDLFAAILEAMTTLREELPPKDDRREDLREAHMRQTIRAAQKEGYGRIAVVCGAWHAPALAKMPSAKDDTALLKNLPKKKVAATWIPWTYSRLSFRSGYGAGIESPGWYDHLWHQTDGVVPRWLTKVARLMRDEGIEISAAHVIETVRLAEALAALRERPLPGLEELNEAILSVMCNGNDAPLQLIQTKLIISERLGSVPSDTPMTPLQQDFERELKRLSLKLEAGQVEKELDLRKPTDLERSQLLHRLNLLGVKWGSLMRDTTRRKGTSFEIWRLLWKPEMTVRLIEMGVYGNSVLAAAGSFVQRQATESKELPALTDLLDDALLADLPQAVEVLMTQIQNVAALTSDVTLLMDALPGMVEVVRYGDMRKKNTGAVEHVIDGLVARVVIGLPGACASLNDEAAEAMFGKIQKTNGALRTLNNETHLKEWYGVLQKLSDREGLHGIVAGRCCLLLLDAGIFTPEDAARKLNLALSPGNEPAQAASWVEGFIRERGQILVHDQKLLGVIDDWLMSLKPDIFTAILPLLRRTFSTFQGPERRQIGERVSKGKSASGQGGTSGEIDPARAQLVLPIIAKLLGVKETVSA